MPPSSGPRLPLRDAAAVGVVSLGGAQNPAVPGHEDWIPVPAGAGEMPSKRQAGKAILEVRASRLPLRVSISSGETVEHGWVVRLSGVRH